MSAAYNLFRCPMGHEFAAVRVVDGVIPFARPCKLCRNHSYSQFTTDVHPSKWGTPLTATVEFYRPDAAEMGTWCDARAADREHVARGGLMARDYTEPPAQISELVPTEGKP